MLHSADKVNYIHKHSRPAPLPWLWEGGMEEEGLEVYRSKAWSTSVRSRSVERRKGQRKGSLSLSQTIKREILLRLLHVSLLSVCFSVLLPCFVVSVSLSIFPVGHGSLGQYVVSLVCASGVPVMHLFSSPLTCPHSGVRGYTLRQRTPAPSDLQLSCSSLNLELFALVLNCLLLLCTHIHFLYLVSQKSQRLFL